MYNFKMKSIIKKLNLQQSKYLKIMNKAKALKCFFWFYCIFFSSFFISCQNKGELKRNQYSYFINSNGDTSRVTKKINDSLYCTTRYHNVEGMKRISQVIYHLEDAMPHGNCKTYHSNGQLKSDVDFKTGKIWNVNKYLDSAGKSLDYGYLNNGEGYLKKYYTDISILEEQGKVKNGFKEGYWLQFCGDGIKICDSTLYLEGKTEYMRELEKTLPIYQIYD